MEMEEETIGAFLAELTRRGCPPWERRIHQARLAELSRWIRMHPGCVVAGQDTQEAFLWWGQFCWCPDWSLMKQRAATVTVFSQWLLDGRVVSVQEATSQDDQDPGNADGH